MKNCTLQNIEIICTAKISTKQKGNGFMMKKKTSVFLPIVNTNFTAFWGDGHVKNSSQYYFAIYKSGKPGQTYATLSEPFLLEDFLKLS